MSSHPAAVSVPTVVSEVDNNTLANASSASTESPLRESLPALSPESEAVANKALRMSIWETFQRNWRAAYWFSYWGASCIMVGYCLALMGNFFASKQFNKNYGSPIRQDDGTIEYEIGAGWKAGLTVGALVGEILGLFGSGVLAKRFGNKITMLGALGLLAGAVLIPAFAPNVATLVVGQVVCGVPWGIFQTLPCTYALEIAPVRMRPILFATINICWLLGQLLSSGVVRECLNLPGPWSYRLPFLLQLVLPFVLFVPVLLSPETPVWFVRRGKTDEAKRSLLRVTQRNAEGFCADDEIKYLVEINGIEKARSKSSSYRECFRGKNLRRTEIAVGAWAAQALCGSVIIGLSTLFYEEAGVPTNQAFTFSMVQSALGIVGGLFSFLLIAFFPRRNLFLFGLLALGTIMAAIGGVSWAGKPSVEDELLVPVRSGLSVKAGWTVGLMQVWVFLYGGTIGPLAYSIASEIGSSRLTTNTIVIARVSYNLCNIAANSIATQQLTSKQNPESPGWGWGTRWTAIFWAASSFVFAFWSFHRAPEQKGISAVEMDSFFERGIRARDFKKVAIRERREKEEAGTRTHENCKFVNLDPLHVENTAQTRHSV